MTISRYESSLREEWDGFIRRSRNATFLFERGFMDYHKDRFSDYSLLVHSAKKELIALFPATYDDKTNSIQSHGGLTYGGLLLASKIGTSGVLEVMQELMAFYKEKGISFLNIKPIPHIYHRSPSEEELYALFRLGAKLQSRSASSTVDLSSPLLFSNLRKRKYKAAESSDLQICMDGDIARFWRVLTDTLKSSHGVAPVHTLAEISKLHALFPQQIKCVTVLDAEGKVLAGTLLFLMPKVVHAQYIAASPRGKQLGALDYLFVRLLHYYQKQYQETFSPLYFDFGISTENNGLMLNEGLIFQKEGFGARTTLYDEYLVDLSAYEH